MGCYVRCLPAAPGSQGRARTPRATDIASTGLSGSLGGAARHARRQECRQIRSHIIALVQVTIDVVMLAPLADFSAVPAINGVQWSYLVILGGVHTCLMYILMYSAFQKLPTSAHRCHVLYLSGRCDHRRPGVLRTRAVAVAVFRIALILLGGFFVNQNLGLRILSWRRAANAAASQGRSKIVEPPARSGPR